MKTWEDMKTVDDLISDGDKAITKEVEEKTEIRCPYLKKLGEFFYYCSGGVPEDTELELDPFNLIVIAMQGTAQLQLHCMDRYKACCYVKGTLSFPGAERKKDTN